MLKQKVILVSAICLALASCGLTSTIKAVFDAPLNVGQALLTSPNNYSVTADDADTTIANAAAILKAASTCANMGQTSKTTNTTTSNTNGRNYFTIDFQCQ
jgi:hypothetical protein